MRSGFSAIYFKMILAFSGDIDVCMYTFNSHFPINLTFHPKYVLQLIDILFASSDCRWTQSAIHWIGSKEGVGFEYESSSSPHRRRRHVTSLKLEKLFALNKKQLDLQVFRISIERIYWKCFCCCCCCCFRSGAGSAKRNTLVNVQQNSNRIKINSWLILILQTIYWLCIQCLSVVTFRVFGRKSKQVDLIQSPDCVVCLENAFRFVTLAMIAK